VASRSGSVLGGKKNAPRPAPEVTRNERSEETGLASPWVNWLADGDRPSATTACSVGCRGRREGALCGQALDGKGRGVGVGALVATRIAVARIRRGDVAGPP